MIVDEFQDLNPLDLEFINALAARGMVLFIAGDDDQSIYSFRYASPSGIQDFAHNNPGCGQHSLEHCFRCTPVVLAAADALIQANAGANRIQKNLQSLYTAADPPVNGSVYRWRFGRDTEEANAIADTCRDLIAAGIPPREILILLSKWSLGDLFAEAMAQRDVPCDPQDSDRLHDGRAGRLLLALMRVVCSRDDYVAHRTVLGLMDGCGIGTCTNICNKVIANNLNFRDLFYRDIPGGVFAGRERNAITQASQVIRQVSQWQADNLLQDDLPAINGILDNNCDEESCAFWRAYAARLPGAMTLEELCDLVWADTDEAEAAALESAYARLGQVVPPDQILPQRVRVMTMHGAKGLSARVVIIPGLEHQTFPGHRRQPYPGLVLEAARLLYVSITRARVATVISYASRRRINGQYAPMMPSRFATQLNGAFGDRRGGLTAGEVQAVVAQCNSI
jgi:DNA helicase II / ATP-dependent DNA helicase PcrA